MPRLSLGTLGLARAGMITLHIGTAGRTRTDTVRSLKPVTLPIGLQRHKMVNP